MYHTFFLSPFVYHTPRGYNLHMPTILPSPYQLTVCKHSTNGAQQRANRYLTQVRIPMLDHRFASEN